MSGLLKLALPFPQIAAALAGGMLLFGAFGSIQTWRLHDRTLERDAARAEIADMNARTRAAAARIDAATRTMAAGAATITKGKNDAIANVLADRDALLVQLQSRPSRTTAPAPGGAADGAGGAGSTGAQLYREDAEFLVGEAADADTIRIALKACYGQYELVRQQLDGLGADH